MTAINNLFIMSVVSTCCVKRYLRKEFASERTYVSLVLFNSVYYFNMRQFEKTLHLRLINNITQKIFPFFLQHVLHIVLNI